MNKHKVEAELIKSKMDSKYKLLKLIEESKSRINKEENISFKNLIEMEKV